MWSEEDEQAAISVEVAADAASTLRAVAQLLLPKGNTFDPDPALRWDARTRPDPRPTDAAEAELNRESIDAAITAALPRG